MTNTPIPDDLDYLRREVILILGHDPEYKGEFVPAVTHSRVPKQRAELEAAIGRCLIRKLNERARKRK